MEIIEVPSYTEEEKIKIAKRHLLPKQVLAHGLMPGSIKLNDKVISTMISGYTSEAGVRALERTLARVVRKAVVDILDKQLNEVRITPEIIKQYLGSPRYLRSGVEKGNRVGVANGMAYTAVGGEMIAVECVIMHGTGALQLTGKLGDVMQESAHAALTWVRSQCPKWGISAGFFKENDIHIHVPEGAVPKDGPSAGITLVTALVSAVTEVSVKQSVAMTGEITLRGRVLPVGGLKEKLLAAYRTGISDVVIPKENSKDLEEIPPNVLQKLHVRYVSNIDEVLYFALVGALPDNVRVPVVPVDALPAPVRVPQINAYHGL